MNGSDFIANRKFPWRAVSGVAALALLLHVATAPRYGYFRDEFYILACGRHLDWGYVDHAPLVALIARVTSLTLGTSLYALRFVTGCSAALKAVITALLARELGGNRFAIIVAALSTLLISVFLAIDNQFSLNTGDPLFWMGTLLAILVSVRLERPKLLVWAGVSAGLAMENKHSAVFFLAALVASALLCRILWHRPMAGGIARPWVWPTVANAVAVVLFLPNLIWQFAHGFPTLEFLNNVNNTHKNVELPPARFLLQQLMMLSPINALLWLPGLCFLLRHKQFRYLGLTYLLTLAIFMALHGKDYYVAPVYPLLLAAGAVFWSHTRGAIWVPIVLVLAAIPVFPVVLPILAPAQVHDYLAKLGAGSSKTEVAQSGLLPQYFGDQFGWPEIAAAADQVYRSLPAAEQAQTAFYTGSYGEAGALEFYGSKNVLSAHNTYWYWGQGADPRTLILVNSERLIREGHCGSVTEGPEIAHPFAMSNERFRIRVCHNLKQPLSSLWPTLKHWS